MVIKEILDLASGDAVDVAVGDSFAAPPPGRPDESLEQDAALCRFLHQSPDAMVIADDEGRYVAVNDLAAALLGYPREQLLRMRVADLIAAEAPVAVERYEKYLESPQDTGEFAFVRPDGSVRIASYSAFRLAPDRHLSILRDLTIQRREETRLHDLNSRLRRAMIESSHRIKNQLQLLTATVDIALMNGEELIPAEEFRRLGSQIRTLAILQDILTLEWKSNSVETVSSVSTGLMLERVLDGIRQSAGNCRMRFRIAETALPIHVVTTLALICTEATGNAIKHGHGGVEICFETSDAEGMLQISDDGPGFSDGFNPRSDANTGIELILSLAAHDLRGSVRFENRAEGGAQVTVSFPLVP